MKSWIQFGVILAGGLLLFAQASRAQSGNPQDQSQQPTQPEQPIGAENPNGGNESENANTIPAVVSPDTENPPLSGVLVPSFGVPLEHSYIQPLVEFQSAYSSNGEYAAGSNPNQSSAMETILGGLTFQKVGRRNELQVNYMGGRTFYSAGDISDSTIQNFGLMDKWVGMRWSGTIADNMSYSSDPIFGSGIGGTGTTPSGVNIQPIFSPGQSVIVPRTPTLNNTSAVEVDYQMSLRASLSFVGTYSFLHYYGPGLINSGATNGQVGYNYRLSQRDTIAGIYRYGLLQFSGNNQSITQNIVEASYGHQIAERWNFQVAGGPSFATINVKGLASQSLVSWALNSSLNYRVSDRTSASVNYTHGLQAGGGTFVGGETDFVTANFGHQLSRNWSISANTGYSRTATLAVKSTPVSNAVDSVVGGAGISRLFGRAVTLGVIYQGYYQVSGHPICTLPACGTSLNYQTVSLQFSWHPVPVAID